MSKRINKKKYIKEESDDEVSETIEETEDNAIEDVEINDDDYEDYNDIDEIEDNDVFNECTLDKIVEDTIEDNENSEIEEIVFKEYLKGNDRISSNRLTKYEMVRILGERTKQLTMGAKPLIKNHEGLDYDKISEEELKLNMIPYLIKRPLPNGKYEIWKLEELYKDHLLALLE